MKFSKSYLMAYGVLFGLYLAYWLFFAIAPSLHAQLLAGEDKGVEWLTFLGFLMAGVVALIILKKNRKGMTRFAVLYFLGLGLFLLVCAGEEISWGQRLIGFETPEVILENNEQAEFNLHNLHLEHIHPKDLVSWFMKLFGIILPVFMFACKRGKDAAWRRYIPGLAVIPAFLWVELLNASEGVLDSHLGAWLGPKAVDLLAYQHEEVVEMYWGLAILVAMVTIASAWKRQLNSQQDV